MKSSYCTQCGAPVLNKAAFCTGCGTPVGGRPPARGRNVGRAPWLERYAGAVVGATVLLITGVAVGVGLSSQPPPNAPVARNPAQPPGRLPGGHPPVEVPEEVSEVLTRMEGVAAAEPDNLDTWKQLAFIQHRAGQVAPAYLDKAAKSYQHILERAPEDLDALRGLGNIAYDRNDAETAMRYYGLYLAAKPDDHEVMTDMGTMLLTAQRIEEAINTYLRVLQADPKFFQAQFNLAIAYRSAERPDLALAALERARDLADDDQQRQRVDALLQKFGSEPSAATARESGPKEAIEAIFRSHPIVGPRLERVDWSSDNQARVILRDFPMDGMPPMVRQKFTERILSGIRQSKERLEITTNYQIEIVDAASGRVMETVSE